MKSDEEITDADWKEICEAQEYVQDEQCSIDMARCEIERLIIEHRKKARQSEREQCNRYWIEVIKEWFNGYVKCDVSALDLMKIVKEREPESGSSETGDSNNHVGARVRARCGKAPKGSEVQESGTTAGNSQKQKEGEA